MKHLTLALALLALPAIAHEVTTDSLVIDHPYALETVATAMSGAGYMTITNTGSAPGRLLEVRADFPRVSLHGTETDAQGVTRMIPVEGIEIAPGETVTLAPGGMHVMFMGLDGDPFEEGERIPATLVFERAGEIAVEFWVEPRDGGMTGHEEHDHSGLSPESELHAVVHAALAVHLGDAFQLGPMAVEGTAAVAGWRVAGETGRAFLREDGTGWRVVLLSGEGLRHAASFTTLGLNPRAAARLAEALAFAESRENNATSDYNAFRGTLTIDDV